MGRGPQPEGLADEAGWSSRPLARWTSAVRQKQAWRDRRGRGTLSDRCAIRQGKDKYVTRGAHSDRHDRATRRRREEPRFQSCLGRILLLQLCNGQVLPHARVIVRAKGGRIRFQYVHQKARMSCDLSSVCGTLNRCLQKRTFQKGVPSMLKGISDF